MLQSKDVSLARSFIAHFIFRAFEFRDNLLRQHGRVRVFLLS